MSNRKLKLALSLYGVGGPSQHNLWKDPRVPKNASIDIQWYIQQAQKAEAAKFDAIFIVDSLFINSRYPGSLSQPTRAAHAAVGPGRRDREHRAGRHPHDVVQLAVQPGPPVRLPRPDQRRSRRLERRHLLRPRGRGQLRAGRALRLRHPVFPRTRVRRGRAGPVGLLRGRRLPGRRRAGRVPGSQQAARAEPQGRVLLGHRSAEPVALTAGSAGDLPVGHVGAGPQAGRPGCRGHLHPRRQHLRRRGVPERHPEPGVRPGPESRPHRDLPGRSPGDRRLGRGSGAAGAGDLRVRQQTSTRSWGRSRGRSAATTSRRTIPTGRSRTSAISATTAAPARCSRSRRWRARRS